MRGRLLEKLGLPYDAGKVLKNAAKRLGDERALKSSIDLGEHLPQTMLASTGAARNRRRG